MRSRTCACMAVFAVLTAPAREVKGEGCYFGTCSGTGVEIGIGNRAVRGEIEYPDALDKTIYDFLIC